MGNLRLNLSDQNKSSGDDRLYISRLTAVPLEEYNKYRAEYCIRYHKEQCKECAALMNMASIICQEGIIKLSDVYKKQFPDKKYQSDKAVRRIMQLPVVVLKYKHLYVTGLTQGLDYRTLVNWVAKTMPNETNVQHLDKDTLKSLCELASNESDRRLIESAVTWGLSGKQAKKRFGIDDNNAKQNEVREAIVKSQQIHAEIMMLAQLEETALLRSMGIEDNASDAGSLDDESDLESAVECDSDDSLPTMRDGDNDSSAEQQSPDDSGAEQQSPDDSGAERQSRPDVSGAERQSRPDVIGHASFNPDELSKAAAVIANPAPSNETLLSWLRDNRLNWFSFFDDVSQYLRVYTQDVLHQVLLDFTEYLSTDVCDLTEDEDRAVEVSRQAFLAYKRREPLLIEGSEVLSDSENEDSTAPLPRQMPSLVSKEGLESIKQARATIRRKAKREAAKQIAQNSILKRKIPKRTSCIIKEHPTIGKDIEDFVVSKKVGADAWRRTGVLTFDGSRTRGKQVTYKGIQEHLQEKYSCKISYGTVVQLCVIRSKRRISAKRYKGVAKVTCRKSRKGFSIKLNPDAHWSSAFYKGINLIQLKDGRDKVLLNRDDQAGFRLDTTFTHKQGKCITLENAPSLTTRTDFVNTYSSMLQTTSYLFMKSDTTDKACAGVVKPHFIFPKNPTQHMIDLEMLENSMPSYFENRPIDCIRVDGATDEGPAHMEVQFLWTERHLLKQKICTIVSSRHSGGSYLNEVELMNGCIAKAHANLFIPSTLAGNNFDTNGLDTNKLNENLEIATDVYIDRVNGAPCCGTTLQLYKGGKNEVMIERRPSLLIFLRGSTEDKQQLRKNNPDLYEYFERIWMVRKSHMKKDLPENYMLMLNLCHQRGCPHPLCGDETAGRDLMWYDNGPPLTYLPIPIPDPKRPWGGKCQECAQFCAGHYLTPKDHAEFVAEHGLTISKPPSIIIREAFYESLKKGRALSEEKMLEVARKTLLPLEELQMHVEHLKLTAERRKEGAKKAANTRKNNAKTKGKAKKSTKARTPSVDTSVWCWCQEREHGDMILCEGDACQIKWFHFECAGLLFSPAFPWYCPDCKVDTEQYCFCNQGELGMMLGCDNSQCPIEWFHLSCVGMKVPPTGSWMCPKCVK